MDEAPTASSQRLSASSVYARALAAVAPLLFLKIVLAAKDTYHRNHLPVSSIRVSSLRDLFRLYRGVFAIQSKYVIR